MQGPGYSVKDLVWYSGLLAGIVLVYTLTIPYADELHQLVRFALGVAVGVGLGWGLETAYVHWKTRQGSDRD